MKSKILFSFVIVLIILSFFYFKTNSFNPVVTKNIIIEKCDSKYKLNSQEYWNCRFKTGDWQANHGDEQTLHFYILLVNSLPKNIQEEINSHGYSVVDFGCAQGEGTEFFATSFPNANVTGVDIAEESIAIAKNKNSKAAFLAEDLTLSKDTWDVLITSNTLEHFYEPWQVLNKLSTKIKKYLIILVPFDQPNIPSHEHFYSFNYQNIPNELNNFQLIHTKIVHPDLKFWGEKQILLIYEKR